jgi:hypothetical protein
VSATKQRIYERCKIVNSNGELIQGNIHDLFLRLDTFGTIDYKNILDLSSQEYCDLKKG